MPVKVFDFFSGCGGTSKGFELAGMDVVFGLDSDPDAGASFRANFPDASFCQTDIAEVGLGRVDPLVDACHGHPLLFSGCAPCQPFTRQRTAQRPQDNRRALLCEFLRFVVRYLPEFVFVENVPGLQKVSSAMGPFRDLLKTLTEHGYDHCHRIVASQEYGVPQMRRRLVLVASRVGPVTFPPETHGAGRPHPAFATVRAAIGGLPPLAAGQSHPRVPNHVAMDLSPLNLARIRATPEGGGRQSWPPNLRLECHNGHSGHTDVYGRMRWGAPATGLTTRCISLSNGRFGHPEQDRAISVREAACLQTFPMDFVLRGSPTSAARQIGNAVPVHLARRFGEHLTQLLPSCTT